MKTIEERAKEYAPDAFDPDYILPAREGYIVRKQRNAYIAGAKEQKAIDDAILLKLKSAWEKQAQINHDDELNYQQGYHDAIEEAKVWFGDYLTELRDSVNWFYGSSKMKSGQDRFMEAMKK